MQRLLMGEVGSGKTVVALHAMLRAVEHGMQAALMAPTETLAEQHFATLQALMPGGTVRAALLTGSTAASRRNDILAKLATGELSLVVGTHALIEETVEFSRLAVAVVDEQHRFGVRQRAALDAKAPPGLAPHVLHMTATPIPRTLRLTSFGALDVTTLRELPRGRQPIDTHVAGGERERERAYERIREELRAGRQAFVVCPLVEESEALQARAATAEYERLQGDGVQGLRRRAAARADEAAREGRGDGGVRRGRRRRARRDDGHRGRHRRAQRDGDARRGRRALRHLAAAPAARPRRPRRARVAVPAVRAEGLAAAQGARRAHRRLPARRDRPRAARRGRDHRHAPVRAGPLRLRAAARRRPAARARPPARRGPARRRSRRSSSPSTPCWPTPCAATRATRWPRRLR